MTEEILMICPFAMGGHITICNEGHIISLPYIGDITKKSKFKCRAWIDGEKSHCEILGEL